MLAFQLSDLCQELRLLCFQVGDMVIPRRTDLSLVFRAGDYRRTEPSTLLYLPKAPELTFGRNQERDHYAKCATPENGCPDERNLHASFPPSGILLFLKSRHLILDPKIQGISVEAPTAAHFTSWDLSISCETVNAFYVQPEVLGGLFRRK